MSIFAGPFPGFRPCISHTPCDDKSSKTQHASILRGGFAEYCYILPGTGILKLPDAITDEEAMPLNCGVATMVSVTEAADIRVGNSTTPTQLVWFAAIGVLSSVGHLAVAQAFKDGGASAIVPADFTRLAWAAFLGYVVSTKFQISGLLLGPSSSLLAQP